MVTSGDTSTGRAARRGGCAGAGPEIGFTFRAPAAGIYTMTTVGSMYDTVLYVRDGSCDGEELACNDDTPGLGLQSRIVVPLTSGQEVVIFVDSYGEGGAFVLNITSEAVPAPGVPNTARSGSAFTHAANSLIERTGTFPLTARA